MKKVVDKVKRLGYGYRVTRFNVNLESVKKTKPMANKKSKSKGGFTPSLPIQPVVSTAGAVAPMGAASQTPASGVNVTLRNVAQAPAGQAPGTVTPTALGAPGAGQSPKILNNKGELEVISKGGVSENILAEGVRARGAEIVRDTLDIAKKYVGLCEYIRTNSIAPKLVAFELGQLGFHRVRVSEINRVANSKDEVWNSFLAASIGFKKALQLTRGTVENVEKELGENMSEGEAEAAMKYAEKSEAESAEKSAAEVEADPIQTKTTAMGKAAKHVLALAVELGIRSHTWKGGGYTLTLSKLKSKKSPAKESAE